MQPTCAHAHMGAVLMLDCECGKAHGSCNRVLARIAPLAQHGHLMMPFKATLHYITAFLKSVSLTSACPCPFMSFSSGSTIFSA